MILAVAATEFEMDAYLREGGETFSEVFVCGVGVLESSLRLTRYLEKHHSHISAVLHFGVAGAYIQETDSTPDLLDICIAEHEILGDLGICYPRRFDDLGGELELKRTFALDKNLLGKALQLLQQSDNNVFKGNFVTVNSVSGTLERGDILRRKYNGLCENMEGAAVARVCMDFSLSLLEMRCISNYVEDRDPTRWRLPEACERAAEVTALVVKNLG